MQLEIIILSEVSQRKTNPYDITYMWNLKYDTKETTLRRKTDSDIEDRLMLAEGAGEGEQWTESLGLADISYYI